MTDINLALTESKSFRDAKLDGCSNDKAFEALNKAKALVMAYWKGENLATTKQLAEYYEVSEDTVQTVVKNNRQELEADGLKVLRGKALKEVVSMIDTSLKSPSLTIWNPRSALRLGMLLRDSEIAKQVRTLMLDAISTIPVQQEQIEILKLQNENLRLQVDANNSAYRLESFRDYVSKLPEPIQQKILGYKEIQSIEYRDRVVDTQGNVLDDGDTVNKGFLCRRYGLITKNGNPDYKRLNTMIELVGLDKNTEAWKMSIVPQTNYQFRKEYLPMLDRLMMTNERQMFIGE